jgi:hypothetical protein
MSVEPEVAAASQRTPFTTSPSCSTTFPIVIGGATAATKPPNWCSGTKSSLRGLFEVLCSGPSSALALKDNT